MSSKPWKLLPLAAIFALMALVLVPGGGVTPPAALATVGISGEEDIDNGGEMTFEVQIDTDEGNVTITVDGGADTTDLTLTIDDCDGEDGSGCDEGDNDDGNADDGVSVTVDSDDISGDITITLTLEADCDDADDTLTISVESDEDNDSATIDCLSDGSSVDGNVIISLESPDDEDADFDFDISGTSSECDDSFTLSDGGDEGFTCDSPGDYTVTIDLPSGTSIDSIDCDTEGDADTTPDEDEGTVEIELNEAEDSVECTFTIEGEGGGGTGGNASSVTVSAGPNSVSCSGSSFITVVVKNAQGGNVADGTTVNVSTNLGSVNPGSATTQGGGVLILYTAPSNQGGNATITAKAGDITNTTTVQVNCSSAPAPTNPPPPPATGGGTIQPPNTGDAGLADKGGHGISYAGLAFIASVVVGTIAFARVRA